MIASLNRQRVYIASPLFTDREREWNVMISEALSEFADVYLPQRDGDLLVDLIRNGMSIEAAQARIFKKDIEAIEWCSVLVIVLDGRVVDEGACVELGYALARGKICVGLKTDVRSLLAHGDNPMIECAIRARFSDIPALREFVKAVGTAVT